ncbi:hypothetical protein B9T26_06615 [Acinetobacter sp. ANC 4169]|nr:hypothetical protein B9T26_06615 [Acinetobacter sp. ANC 4169]
MIAPLLSEYAVYRNRIKNNCMLFIQSFINILHKKQANRMVLYLGFTTVKRCRNFKFKKIKINSNNYEFKFKPIHLNLKNMNSKYFMKYEFKLLNLKTGF